MKNLIKAEEAAMLVFGVYLFSLLPYAWWWFAVLFLLPDLGMVGYAVNTKTGAFLYNLFHHKGVAILLYVIGIYLNNNLLQLAGVILFSHASFDRMFGYGLKYNDSFHHTHLGMIGKQKE